MAPCSKFTWSINNYNTESFAACLYNYGTPDILAEIENLTTGQSSNSLWFSYRCGVITASVAHTILSICKRFKSAPGATERIIGKILNYSKSVRAASLSYGIEYEQYAKKR